ncbi:hypothetical protein [Pedobacter cryoconitis]|uniref:Lipopolysaccharide assembly outer membrane protein LptD (OstA) n=1 Tax=Pedobacter cryoconitis TaxID=188932 RepID=A0A7X0J2S1_9SPHI|nr:hypothetical protein [Pedobacter cryoconitis]MBB6499402.1 lipopolysaccharide assembly outer membrane protein LptD (OstA) [Pedobacter cryoconitis]
MKLSANIILLISIVLLVSDSGFTFASQGSSITQVSQERDTAKKIVVKTQLRPAGAGTRANFIRQGDSKLAYSAVDSTKYSKDGSTIYLYGKAKVTYQSFELDADYITYNSKTNTVFASGRKNQRGRYAGRPVILMEKQGASVADSILMNVKSGTGTVFH